MQSCNPSRSWVRSPRSWPSKPGYCNISVPCICILLLEHFRLIFTSVLYFNYSKCPFLYMKARTLRFRGKKWKYKHSWEKSKDLIMLKAVSTTKLKRGVHNLASRIMVYWKRITSLESFYIKQALRFSDSELEGTSYNFPVLRKEHVLSTSERYHVHRSVSLSEVLVEMHGCFQTLLWVSTTRMSSCLDFPSADTELLTAWTTQQPVYSLLLPQKESDDRSKVKELMI